MARGGGPGWSRTRRDLAGGGQSVLVGVEAEDGGHRVEVDGKLLPPGGVDGSVLTGREARRWTTEVEPLAGIRWRGWLIGRWLSEERSDGIGRWRI